MLAQINYLSFVLIKHNFTLLLRKLFQSGKGKVLNLVIKVIIDWIQTGFHLFIKLGFRTCT